MRRPAKSGSPFWTGILTEAYYPAVDRPQLRDLQLPITDGKSFLHEEKRALACKLKRLSAHARGYRCTNTGPEGRYAIVREIIAGPQRPCVLQRIAVTGDSSSISQLRLYALCAPHLQGSGSGNNESVARFGGATCSRPKNRARTLLPEQVGDPPDQPQSCMYLGRPTGSAMPLMRAHAEYIKLLRSVADGNMFDLIREAAERYLGGPHNRLRLEVWKPNRQVSRVNKGPTLHCQMPAPFRLHWRFC